MAPSTEHIVIIGPMAAGKTTVGKGIAESLGLGFFDSDDQIRALTGRDGARIADTDGVDALHRLELQVFWDAFNSEYPVVIAAAASVIEDPMVRDALQNARCVWVDAEDKTLRLRRSSATHRREVTDEEARRLAKRDPLFARCADLRVDTGSMTEPDAVATVLEGIAATG